MLIGARFSLWFATALFLFLFFFSLIFQPPPFFLFPLPFRSHDFLVLKKSPILTSNHSFNSPSFYFFHCFSTYFFLIHSLYMFPVFLSLSLSLWVPILALSSYHSCQVTSMMAAPETKTIVTNPTKRSEAPEANLAIIAPLLYCVQDVVCPSGRNRAIGGAIKDLRFAIFCLRAQTRIWKLWNKHQAQRGNHCRRRISRGRYFSYFWLCVIGIAYVLLLGPAFLFPRFLQHCASHC